MRIFGVRHLIRFLYQFEELSVVKWPFRRGIKQENRFE
jgi:hypothetical protein